MRKELEDRMHREVQAKRAELRKKLARIGLYVGGALFVVVGAWILFKPPVECKRGTERARAFAALRGIKDAQTNQPVLDRFEDGMFQCADVDSPAGTLIAVRENPDAGEESMIWFVPKDGSPQSVNLLADAWTPRLGAAPNFTPETLAEVTK